MDRLFFDTNVLLDVLERRAPWFPESTECLSLVRSGVCKGAFSALSLSDIAYIQRAEPVQRVYAAFEKLRRFLTIAPLNTPAVDAALARKLEDFEDGLQLEAALAWKSSHLLTRNVRDFPEDTALFILTPSDFLEAFRSS